MLNTRWPGDVPPLKRLFGTKLKTVYLKKQIYNSACWITGRGWWGRGDVDGGTLGVSELEGHVGEGLRLPTPSHPLSAAEWAMDTTPKMLEILEWVCVCGGGGVRHQQQRV